MNERMMVWKVLVWLECFGMSGNGWYLVGCGV